MFFSSHDLAFCFLLSEGKVSKTSGVLRINIRALHTTSTTTIIIRNRITAVRVPTIHPIFSSARNTTCKKIISRIDETNMQNILKIVIMRCNLKRNMRIISFYKCWQKPVKVFSRTSVAFPISISSSSLLMVNLQVHCPKSE